MEKNLAQEFSNQPSQEEMTQNAKMSFDNSAMKLVEYYDDTEARKAVDDLVRKVSSISYLENNITKIVGVPIAFDVKKFTTNSPIEGEKIEETSVKVVIAYLAPGYSKPGPGIKPLMFPGKIKTKTLRASFFEETKDLCEQFLSAKATDVLEVDFTTLEPKMSSTLGKLIKETPIVDFKFVQIPQEGEGEIGSTTSNQSAEEA